MTFQLIEPTHAPQNPYRSLNNIYNKGYIRVFTFLLNFSYFQDILGEDGVFLYPTHPTAAPLHHEPLIKAFNFSYTAIINVLGLPATACPLGLNKQGLPIGIQAWHYIYLIFFFFFSLKS